MRLTTKLMTAGAALVLATAPVAPRAHAAPVATTAAMAALHAVPTVTTLAVSTIQDAKIDVKISDDKGGAWYTNPVWIAIGIIALVLIIALIAMAGRRDTTVVK
ncbi:MAG: hypothetical protein ACREMI_06420 [Gemmatimonadales bacterium]